MTDLSSYRAIRTNFLVKIVIPSNPTILMTDSMTPITYSGDTYNVLGQLLSISDSSSDLKLSNQEITISMSGIPLTSIADFMAQPIRGSKVQVWRSVNQTNGTNIATVGRFKGIINSYSINESIGGRDESITINLICRSQVGQVSTRIAGSHTNPSDWASRAPNDRSMDRVPSLANAKIQFGGI
jgi:hypothetical protein